MRLDRVAADRADAVVVELAAAALVAQHHRRPVRRRVLVAPLEQRDEDRPEVDALAREAVLEALRALLVALALAGRPRRRGAASRGCRTLRATPRLRWKSSKRRMPRKASRRISSVQRSPTTSSARGDRAVLARRMSFRAQADSCMMLTNPVLGAFHHATHRRSRTVLTVVSRRRVHGQPRPVHRQHRVPGHPARLRRARASRALSWVLNAYAIVFAALLVPAGRLGRPRRAQARVPARPRRLHASRSAAVRGRAVGRVARRRARACRRPARRCCSRPRSACCCPSSRPSERARSRSASGPRWAASPPRPGPPLGGLLVEVELALGVPRQPARRPRRASWPRARVAARGRATRATARGPTCSAPRCSSPASASLDARRSSRAATGAGARARGRGCSPRPRCSAVLPARARARHPAPVVELAIAARALVRARRASRRCCSSSAFAAMLLGERAVADRGVALSRSCAPGCARAGPGRGRADRGARVAAGAAGRPALRPACSGRCSSPAASGWSR